MVRNCCEIFIPVFISVLICSFTPDKENYQLKTYTSDNGLSNNFIQCITQDQTGFLWIATWDGLSRFDGYDFKNYYHKPEDSTSIPFFVVDKVVVDKLNQVWILCQGRPAMILNRANDTFIPFSLGINRDSRVNEITLGPDKKMWVSNTEALYNYDSEKKIIKCVKPVYENSLTAYNIASQIAFDNLGGIWLYYLEGNEYQIFKGNFQNDSILKVKPSGIISLSQFKSPILHNSTGNFEFYLSESGKIWLFTKYGLHYYDQGKRNFVKNENPVNPLEFKGKSHFVWAEEKTGIQIIDTEIKSLTTLGMKGENFIETVFIDQIGNIWSGDINQAREQIGLHKYQKVPDYFKHYLTGKNENKLPNSVTRILKDNQNNLWIGIKNLDYLIQIKPDGTEGKIKLKDYFPTKYQNIISGLAKDSNGIWIGTESGQLIYYDYSAKKPTLKYPFQNTRVDNSFGVQNMFKTNDIIIIYSSKGIYRFATDSNRMKFTYKQLNIKNIFTLVDDNNNGFWLGSFTNTVIHLDSIFEPKAYYRFGNGTNIVDHICLGDKNDIWVALMGGGLGHLNLATGKTEIFSASDGLSSNVTYGILKDKMSNFWISTNQGISRFNHRTRQFRNFGKENGLLVTDFNPESCFQSPDGELFFGGNGGLISFFPDSIENKLRSRDIKPLIITEFKVSGITRFFNKPVYEMDSLELEKGDNNFQFTFACLNFQNPEKIKYRYRIAALKDTWTETNYRNRTVSFANLSPGVYDLEIEATDQNDEWNLKTKVLISIPYKFQELKEFRVLAGITLALIFLVFSLLYVKQIKLRESHKQNELKLESLRGQMNPHFIFNSLNSINYFISNNDKLSANIYIADFSRLIRGFLSNLSKDFISFEKELESLHDYLNLEHLRFGNKFDYSVNTEKIKNSDEILIFPAVVQPFIENAIWHGVRGLDGRKGFIRVIFLPADNDHIQCIIEDNGIGRKLSEEYKSQMPGTKSRGLGIVNERLQLINRIRNTQYSIIIEDLFPDMKETGTRVTVDIPVKIIEQG
jgi:ligand-binding sensor domain-containing protein